MNKTYQLLSESINKTEENPIVKKDRLTKPFIYLYHGTNYKNFKELDPKIMGTHWDSSTLTQIEKITGSKQPVIFLASDKRYAKTYGKIILKVKVYTKYLYFSMSQYIGPGYIDEYLYTKKIPFKDIEIVNES